MDGSISVAYAGELVGMPAKDAMQPRPRGARLRRPGRGPYRQVESYSTGMKQRLKIASAIVHDPRLLILDEPTNGMDPAGRDDVLDAGARPAHNKGMSLLFSSHLLPDVEAVCDYVIVLGRGQAAGPGADRELKQLRERTVEVRVKNDPVAFARKLEEGGCTLKGHGELLQVQLPKEASHDLLWKAAAALGEQIRYLRPQRNTLEEVFLRAMERAAELGLAILHLIRKSEAEAPAAAREFGRSGQARNCG